VACRALGDVVEAARSLDMTDVGRHNEAQLEYFERTAKPRMIPRRSRYLERHVDELVRFAQLSPDDAVLEVGAGMGRYTIPLLRRGYDVEALDLSATLLDRLVRYGGADAGLRGLHAVDIASPPLELEGRFDLVIGLFTLHHLHDLESCFRGMRRVLRQDGRGRIAFLEPNPLNPLFYLQILLTPGMTWDGDGGIVRMRPGPVFRALAAAGFGRFRHERFGFFPPFLADRARGAQIERRLERVGLLRPFLPFQLFAAEAL
jgi:SAM-dependent methyltransferase